MSELDALHLAFVSQIGTRMVVVTSDQPMQRTCQRMELAYCDPLEIDKA